MNTEIILELLKKGEGFTVEYKECQSELSDSLYETVCSFSNRYGGHILLGVEDSGKVKGVNPKAVPGMKRNFVNTLNNRNKISPSLYLELQDIVIDGMVVLYVYIPVSSMPVTCTGKLFDRNNDADIDITTTTVLAAELYDRKRNIFTERKLFPYVTEDQLLLPELMKKVRIMAQTQNAEHPWLGMTDMEIMRSADLYEIDPNTGQEGFNLAGILLFGRDETILSCCPGYVTDCIARRHYIDRYDDRLMVTCNIIDAYKQVLGFILKHTPDPFYLEGAQSVSVQSKIAREVVSNSLCHREYSSTIPARIVIENNEIHADNWNRSNLYGKLDPNTFRPHPKNPILARFFINIRYADILGSGVRNLYKYTPIYANGKEPELIEGDIFHTIVPLPEFFAIAEQNYEEQTTPTVATTGNNQINGTNGGTDGTSIRPPLQSATSSDTQAVPSDTQATFSDTQATLSDRKSTIISLLEAHGKATSSDIASFMGVTNNWVRTILRQMVNDGTIEKIGDNRYAYYVLKQ